MTPAIKKLKNQAIAFKLHRYEHDPYEHNYGDEVVQKLSFPAEKIFKTLIVQTEKATLAVAVIPVNKQLNLKTMAKTLNCKKVSLADAKLVEKSTGYILGAVSPIGQKKPLLTLLDESALNFNTVFISGGKRGLEIEISPQDLLKATQGKIALLT